MTNLCCDVLRALSGKTLVTAESCTGGGVGMELTAVPGSSSVFKGGVICYTNWVKENILHVPHALLETYGAVSQPVARAMAMGVREVMQADVALSVTGLAGPDGDEFGKPVGTVYVGYADEQSVVVKEFRFLGNRAAVREQAMLTALQLVLEMNK